MFKISPCKDSLNYTKSHEIQNHQRCTHDRGDTKTPGEHTCCYYVTMCVSLLDGV